MLFRSATPRRADCSGPPRCVRRICCRYQPVTTEDQMNTSNPRKTHILWVKGDSGVLHPKQARYQASLQPDSGFIFSILAQRVARALPLPGTSPRGRQNAMPLPAPYKPVENIRRTYHGPRFGGCAIGWATITLPVRALRMRRRDGRHRDGSGEF